uniref:Uncharacterized protein n=1 Tax=Anguilla anguilla TaxID=7936 RepID=A0A0E9UZT0_ANGAN
MKEFAMSNSHQPPLLLLHISFTVIFMVIRTDINVYNYYMVLLNVRDKIRC